MRMVNSEALQRLVLDLTVLIGFIKAHHEITQIPTLKQQQQPVFKI